MIRLSRHTCGGFLPPRAAICPSCGVHVTSSRLRPLGMAVAGGAIAFTLMACYGKPPCRDGSRHCYDPPPAPNAEGGPSGATDPPASASATPKSSK